MLNVLTHVLVGYVFGILQAFCYEWVRGLYVMLVMFGALSPDLLKVSLVLEDATVASLLGLPFAWQPLHTLGRNLVVILLAVLLLAPEYRKSALLLLVVRADSHHVLDLLLQNASGYAYPVLWPVTEYSPPAGMLYRSSDRWPAKVATVVAGVVSCVDRRWIDRVASRM